MDLTESLLPSPASKRDKSFGLIIMDLRMLADAILGVLGKANVPSMVYGKSSMSWTSFCNIVL